MQRDWTSLVSAFGIPALGLCGLLFSLWHTNSSAISAAADQELIFLQAPSLRLDKSLTICLRQQARDVARCRARMRPGGLAQAVAGYNLIARECTPAVFTATHLPPSMRP